MIRKPTNSLSILGSIKVWLIFGTAFSLAACAHSETDGQSTQTSKTFSNVKEQCTDLQGMQIVSSAIGLPTSGALVTSAMLISSEKEENNNGEYCQVNGKISPVSYTAPDINFQVNLPSNWNRKSLQFGGGGLNGVLITGLGSYMKQPSNEQTPLGKGYITLGSDSGHQSAGGFDGTFYLNEEALRNFGHQQIKKTHDVAMLLSAHFYGEEPQYNYFIGGSQGGHEGFDAAQRFPEDYDGIVAGYPAHNVIMLHLSALNYAKALLANDGKSWLSPTETNFLREQVYAACDSLDGLEDGIISLVSACAEKTKIFKGLDDSNPLRCAGGQDSGDDCLADAQIQALNVMDSPYSPGFRIFNDDDDSAVFPRWTPFEGSTFVDGGFPNLGAGGPEDALQLSAGDSTSRLAIVRNPNYNTVADFVPLEWAGRIIDLTSVMSANSTNLDRFRARGGKLLTFHGTIDDFITPYSSIQYYERMLESYGTELSDFYRFYTIPGMGHVTGPFNARVSSLDYLEAWVERGIAPDELVATDANSATAGRSRPVCHYPLWPSYDGSGDVNQAASFSCAE